MADRQENIRRIAEVVKLLAEAGVIAMKAFISPFRAGCEWARSLFGAVLSSKFIATQSWKSARVGA